MRVLLDTHVLLWALNGDRRLPAVMRPIIESLDNEVRFSAASVWEVAIKSSLGRDDFKMESSLIAGWAEQCGFEELSIRSGHAAAVVTLPKLHSDPFDRLLLAQAHQENLTILTVDRAMLAYGPVCLQ